MSESRSTVKPPGPVYVSIWIVYLGAFYNFAVAIWYLSLAFRDDRVEFWDSAIPDSWLWINAILSALLGAIYVWLGNQMREGDAQARFTTIILATINIVFGLFSFPLGAVGMVLSLILILLLSQQQSKSFFRVP